MKYNRPQYGDPSIETQTVRMAYGTQTVSAPKFDTEITPRENFRRAITRQDPLWFPNGLIDKITIDSNDAILAPFNGMQLHTDFLRVATEDYEFKDWFNTDWTWVCSVGGAMLTPGTQLVDDVTKWDKIVKFPNLADWGFEEKAAKFMKESHDPSKAVSYDMGRGLTERFVAIMGGYEASMESLLLEPEAVADFFEAYTEFYIKFFDKMSEIYPLDMVTIHDDWGTERDTFFSEKVMETLVFEPTKRIIDHIKAKDVLVEWHTCGNVTRFFPYMVELGVDVLQIQRRAVDVPLMRQKYGDKVGFCAMAEGIDLTQPFTGEEYVAAISRTVDIFAPGGGSYLFMFNPDPKIIWDACCEAYFRSREIYDNERG